MNKHKLIRLISLIRLIGCLGMFWAGSAFAFNCTVNIDLDTAVWGGGQWGVFFVTQPDGVASNFFIYPGKGVSPTMKAVFSCAKTTYLEIHAVRIDLPPTLPAVVSKNNLGASVTGYEYWSRCFGMIPEFTDQQDVTLKFPALGDTSHQGTTTTHYR